MRLYCHFDLINLLNWFFSRNYLLSQKNLQYLWLFLCSYYLSYSICRISKFFSLFLLYYFPIMIGTLIFNLVLLRPAEWACKIAPHQKSTKVKRQGFFANRSVFSPHCGSQWPAPRDVATVPVPWLILAFFDLWTFIDDIPRFRPCRKVKKKMFHYLTKKYEWRITL